jgi:hypothetical protein
VTNKAKARTRLASERIVHFIPISMAVAVGGYAKADSGAVKFKLSVFLPVAML